MVNQQLLDYIKQQLAAGTAKDAIQQALVGQGWNVSDITETFAALVPQPAPAPAATAPIQSPVSQPATKPQSHLMVWILILVLLVASAGGAAAYYYFMMQPMSQVEQTVDQDAAMLDTDASADATATSNPVTDVTPAVNPADDTNPFTTQSTDNGYQNPF